MIIKGIRAFADGMLVQAAETANQEDVRALYHAHHGWLHTWLRKKLGNPFDAADLAHDTFLRLMATRKTRNLGSEPRALLTHVAKGLIVDHWRRQAVERAYLDTLASQPECHAPSPETRLLILESLCLLDNMLRAMPGKTRDVFLLAQLDGLSYADIAHQMGMALITVKRHMRKGFIACMAVM